MSDLSQLSQPEIATSFDRTVDLFITANEREEIPLMAQAYSEFARLASLTGVERDLLLDRIRTTALARIRGEAGSWS